MTSFNILDPVFMKRNDKYKYFQTVYSVDDAGNPTQKIQGAIDDKMEWEDIDYKSGSEMNKKSNVSHIEISRGASMKTWSNVRDAVDAVIKKHGLDDVDICWIDISSGAMSTAGIYIVVDKDGLTVQ